MKPFTKIASVLFGIIAFVHAARLMSHFQISVGETEVPLWINWIGLFVAALFSYGLWKESNNKSATLKNSK